MLIYFFQVLIILIIYKDYNCVLIYTIYISACHVAVMFFLHIIYFKTFSKCSRFFGSWYFSANTFLNILILYFPGSSIRNSIPVLIHRFLFVVLVKVENIESSLSISMFTASIVSVAFELSRQELFCLFFHCWVL